MSAPPPPSARMYALNLTQTLDVAAHLLARADGLWTGDYAIPDAALHAYWVYSRDLTHQWMQNLTVCQRVMEMGPQRRARQCWLEYEPDIREILRADILQRTWYVILQASDKQRRACHAEPIARSVLAAQMQARVRALRLVLAGHQIDAARMQGLNQLRRTAESWSDLLCAHLATRHEVPDVLFDEKRARIWAQTPLTEMLPELKIPGASSAIGELNRELCNIAPQQFPLGSLQTLTARMLDCLPPARDDQTLRRPTGE